MEPDPDPDPLVRGTDPHQMLRIPNTSKLNFSVGEYNRRCKLKCVSLILQNMLFTQNLAHINDGNIAVFMNGIWAVVGKCDESIALP